MLESLSRRLTRRLLPLIALVAPLFAAGCRDAVTDPNEEFTIEEPFVRGTVRVVQIPEVDADGVAMTDAVVDFKMTYTGLAETGRFPKAPSFYPDAGQEVRHARVSYRTSKGYFHRLLPDGSLDVYTESGLTDSLVAARNHDGILEADRVLTVGDTATYRLTISAADLSDTPLMTSEGRLLDLKFYINLNSGVKPLSSPDTTQNYKYDSYVGVTITSGVNKITTLPYGRFLVVSP